MRRIGPLIKIYGSKWSAARLYPAPQWDHIYEPFAGGAGYSLNYYSKNITIWDTNPEIAALWRWFIDWAQPADVLAIPLNLPVGTDIQQISSLSYEQKLLLKFWQRTNNVSSCWTVSNWGNLPGQWTASTRSRVAREIPAIKHWKFLEPDYSQVGTWFIDPPYLFNYHYGQNPVNHYELANKINKLPTGSQIIACEATKKGTLEFPDYLPFKFFARRITSRRRQRSGDTEQIYSKELIYYKNWDGSDIEQ